MPQASPPTPASKFSIRGSNRSLIIGLFVSVLLMGAIATALVLLNRVGPAGNSAADETRRTIAQLTTYPASYQQAGLPRYPGGEVTSLSPDADDQQPVVIYVNTTDSISKVTEYYAQQLSHSEWQENSGRSSDGSGVTTKIFQKEQQEYRLTITRDSETNVTNIIISWQKQNPS